MKKLIALVLAAALLLTCCSALAEAKEGYPAKIEGLDFGGKDVYFLDYWTGTEWYEDTSEKSEQDQATFDYRMWLQDTYNVKIHNKAVSDWGGNPTELINFTAAPDGSLRVYIIEPGSVVNMISKGIVRSWSDLGVDLTAEKWNQADLAWATKDGKVYGVYAGKTEPRQMLYFNKRILKDAGIDVDTELYEAVEKGTWTWDKYVEMLEKITKDTDNDGVPNIWGVTGDHNDMYYMAVFTNGAKFFDYDENGKLQPVMEKDGKALEALNWAREIFMKYWHQPEEGAIWNWFVEDFRAGNAGFMQYQGYSGFGGSKELEGMEEWGMVPFPVHTAGDTYVTVAQDNMALIPNVYTDEEAKMIAQLYDLWTNPTPGYEDESDNWVGDLLQRTDETTVFLCYAMLREPEHTVTQLAFSLGQLNDVLGATLTWNLSWETPAQAFDASRIAWQNMCNQFNGDPLIEVPTEEAPAEEAPAEEAPAT